MILANAAETVEAIEYLSFYEHHGVILRTTEFKKMPSDDQAEMVDDLNHALAAVKNKWHEIYKARLIKLANAAELSDE